MDKNAMWNKMIGIIKQDDAGDGLYGTDCPGLCGGDGARELGEAVRFADARVSANLMKNGMGVTVPGTGTPGPPILPLPSAPPSAGTPERDYRS